MPCYTIAQKGSEAYMAELVREPIGLRVLLRAVRPHDDEPLLLWRADPQAEMDRLIEAGEAEDRAALWAALLRWSEAATVARALSQQGWTVSFHGVRAIALAHATGMLTPPTPDQGWTFAVEDITLQAISEEPHRNDESLERLLAFLGEERR